MIRKRAFQRNHLAHKTWILLAGFWAICALSPRPSQAHPIQQARVVHILVHHRAIELYINFLLPQTPKTRLWMTLFDRNRNRKLEPPEQRALGKYLARFVRKDILLQWHTHTLKFALKEVQNSRMRGDHRRNRYCWDYHFRASHPSMPSTSSPPSSAPQSLIVSIPPMFRNEQIPVAVVTLAGFQLLPSPAIYTFKRNQQSRAVCQINAKRPRCTFPIAISKPSPTSQPTQRPQ